MSNITASQIPGKKNKPFDPLVFLLSRGLSIAIFGALLLLITTPLALKKAKPFYETSGNMMITPELKQYLNQNEDTITGSFKDYARTQVHRLTTEDVLAEALQKLDRESWPAYLRHVEESEVAARILKRRINVEHLTRSYLIQISLGDGNPGGLAEMINSIMNSYIQKLQQEQEDQTARRVTYIRKEMERSDDQIIEIRQRIAEIGDALKSNAFNDNQNLNYQYVVELQKDYLEAYTESIRSRNFHEFEEIKADRFNPEDLHVYAKESVSRNEAIYLVKNWTYQQLQELRASIDGLTAQNPDRIYVETRMDAMNDYLETFEKDLYGSFLNVMQEKSEYELTQKLFNSEGHFEAIDDVVEELKTSLAEARLEFENSSRLIAEGKELRSQLSEQTSRKSFLSGLLSEVSLEAKAPLRIQIEEMASAPLGPIGNSKMKMLLLAFTVSLGLPGLVFLAFDLLDDRIRRKSDLSAAVGAEPVGIVPQLTGASHDERIPEINRIAVRFEQDQRQNDSNVFMVAGVDPRLHQHDFCDQLALSLAEYSGRIVVADFGEELDFDYPDNVTRLSLKFKDSRRELLEQLDLLKRTYDFVIIDGGYLKGHATTQYLIPEADAVIFTAWANNTRFKELRESLLLSHSLGVRAISSVLCGAQPEKLDEVIDYKNKVFGYISALHRLFESVIFKPKRV